jgi:hypothetical protein
LKTNSNEDDKEGAFSQDFAGSQITMTQQQQQQQHGYPGRSLPIRENVDMLLLYNCYVVVVVKDEIMNCPCISESSTAKL